MELAVKSGSPFNSEQLVEDFALNTRGAPKGDAICADGAFDATAHNNRFGRYVAGAFTLKLRSSATRSRELATTATRSVIDAITPQLHSSATRSRELATTATRSVIEAVTRRAATKSRKPGTPRSVIDAWLIMSGNVQSEGEIQIDGKIKGDIRCTQLIVGRDATIIDTNQFDRSGR